MYIGTWYLGRRVVVAVFSNFEFVIHISMSTSEMGQPKWCRLCVWSINVYIRVFVGWELCSAISPWKPQWRKCNTQPRPFYTALWAGGVELGCSVSVTTIAGSTRTCVRRPCILLLNTLHKCPISSLATLLGYPKSSISMTYVLGNYHTRPYIKGISFSDDTQKEIL